MRDTRYEWAYIFGAACPARGVGAALVLPRQHARNEPAPRRDRQNRRARRPCPGRLHGAGWHRGDDLVVPKNLTLLKLPPYAPELNGAENIWEYLRKNGLSNRLYDGYEHIVDACCRAWNAFVAKPALVTSITSRSWIHVS